MKPKLRRNLLRIVPFGLIWLLVGLVILLMDLTRSGPEGLEGPINPNNQILVFAIVAQAFIGLIVGAIEILLLERRFRGFSFGRKISYKFLIYGAILFVAICFAFAIAAMMEMNTSLTDPVVWQRLTGFLMSTMFINTGLHLSVSLLLSLLYAAIVEHLGQNVLINLITGRYHQPMVERRIFMFLDMKDSTTIAEKLGHVRYFDFLQNYYETMSDPIIESLGEVYQYVGDEVVISWPLDRGIEQCRCIEAFFRLKRRIVERRDYFITKFGEVPDFKAGMHVGEVTAGEVGALKKEIVFTGDVLNTAARLQALTSAYDRDLILSRELLDMLAYEGLYVEHDLGTVQLKGKAQSTKICAVRKKTAERQPVIAP